VLTKLAVFAVAAALTWPLSRMVGSRAWWGLAVFGALLTGMTAVVFVALGRGDAANPAEDENEDDPLPPPETPIELEVGDAIDLHSFPPRDIPDVVADYLETAHAKGFRQVRLIHGRGIGVQRDRVRSVLADHPFVEAFHDATPDRGGWGATIAYLSKNDS
jgi:dsDNA-specific endonuclease/ATPase MutS2